MSDADQVYLGRRVDDEKPVPPEPWDSREERQRKKTLPRDRAGKSVYLTRDQLKSGHTHVRGRTGSGKSQLVLLPMVLQLLKEYDLRYTDAFGNEQCIRERDAVFIFDNGGDRALHNATRHDAENKHGRKFRCLALDPTRSVGFDPFQSVPEDEHRIIRLCSLLTEALHMDHGLVYGGAYYSQRNLAQLLAVAEMAVEEKRAGRSIGIREIDEYIQEKRHQIKDAEQVRMVFRFLLQYDQLQPARNDPEAIDFKRAIRDREVIYFFTPTIGEAQTARQISGLGLYVAVNAAIELAEQRSESERDRPVPHCHVFVDEFQELAGRSFAVLLAQARKFGISIVMANQTTEQLENRDVSLADMVRDNTTTKIYFTATGRRDTDELQSYSKDARAVLGTHRPGGGFIATGGRDGKSDSYSEYVTPLLTTNDIIDTTASAGEFYLVDQSGRGHKEPIRTKAEYVLKEADYRRYLNTPLPVTKRETPRLPAPDQSEREAEWKRRHGEAPDAERQVLLKKLYDQVIAIRNEQRWV